MEGSAPKAPSTSSHDEVDGSPRKRRKASPVADSVADSERKGVVPIKHQYLVDVANVDTLALAPGPEQDDGAEAATYHRPDGSTTDRKTPRARGQNTGRDFGNSRDAIALCQSRAIYPEFSPGACRFGQGCRFEHDLRRYLNEGKRADLTTFGGRCPVWDARGVCGDGWKCRFVASHMEEREHSDGRKELVLTVDDTREAREPSAMTEEGVVNAISLQQKTELSRRRVQTPKADAYLKSLDEHPKPPTTLSTRAPTLADDDDVQLNGNGPSQPDIDDEGRQDHRARDVDPPLRPSEKRRLYFGSDTPVLAPLTTQGNLPFRRLCVDLGAQLTYSEMAMSLPLMQGAKSEWALLKAHLSEADRPRRRQGDARPDGYDESEDVRFGAQIAASKAWQALKATEIITSLCPSLRLVDLNCGCPIDLVYRTGAGSALLDNSNRLEKILRGMNVVSGHVPITVKLRMGTKDGKPTALKLVQRLILGGHDADGHHSLPSGVAAITLHGRSRQQRYTKSADWEYISQCAALIKRIGMEGDRSSDTVREADPRDGPATSDGKVYFLGNGDCFSHVDYYQRLEASGVDAIMLGRGPLIKPWIFEEIEQQQYLDKSASERLAYIERFARYGLEAWGADEVGLGTTRRFLLDWLSFAHRYVPLGLLEHLPPRIQDRPPRFQGRNDLETLLASTDYRDWIKISEMFLGTAHPNFRYIPKQKSNAWELESQG